MNTWIVSFSRQFHLETASNFPEATARRTNLGVANSSSTAPHFRSHQTPPEAWTFLLRGRKPPATPRSVNQVQQMPPRWDCKLQIISYSLLLQRLRLLAARRRLRCKKVAGLLNGKPRRTWKRRESVRVWYCEGQAGQAMNATSNEFLWRRNNMNMLQCACAPAELHRMIRAGLGE